MQKKIKFIMYEKDNVVFQFEETAKGHTKWSLFGLEFICKLLTNFLKDYGNISTREEEMLGHLRKVCTQFKHKPFTLE